MCTEGAVAFSTRAPRERARQADARAELSLAPEPIVNLALGLAPRNAVLLLNAAGKFLAVAFDDIGVIIGKLDPLSLDAALELLSIAFDLVPIHRDSPEVA